MEDPVSGGAAADAVDGGVDQAEVSASVLIGQGDEPAQKGALALVPPLSRMKG